MAWMSCWKKSFGRFIYRPQWILISLLLILLLSIQVKAVEEGVIIHVNRKQNLLTVYMNEVPIYRFLVATGRPGHPTPAGQFTITTKVYHPWYLPKNIPGGSAKNPLGTRWLGLSVPGTGGYKYGIHGTNRNDLLGNPVSTGCIRMRNQDVEFLFRHLPIGTKVIIE